MAELHVGTTLTPTKEELIAGWIGRQRWYAGKGRRPALRRVRSFRFDDPAGRVGIESIVVADGSAGHDIYYQVPLTYRDTEVPELAHALVGSMMHGVLGRRYVYDACHDPAFADALLDAIQREETAASSRRSDAPDPSVRGFAHPGWGAPVHVERAEVLSGEQSNTSIIVQAGTDSDDPRPVIVKVFRILAIGVNPDVELQGAIRSAGCERVPLTVGHLRADWADPEVESPGDLAGVVDLAFAQEFMPGAEDAWRVALRACTAHEDFRPSARALGRATAEVHQALASSMGTTSVGEDEKQRTVASMSARLADAVAAAPSLAPKRARIEHILSRAGDSTWPPAQRIHGDLHLGQILHTSGMGWMLVDFEGEPMRPLAERTAPDQWIRDVAGMLRSFDYAGASVQQNLPHLSTREWVEDAQRAYLDGYAEQAGVDPRDLADLLAAFVIDKCCYEVVYEVRNRPTWVDIPLGGIDRLLPQPTTVSEESSDVTTTPPTTAPDPFTAGAIQALVQGRHQAPHDLLGQHLEIGGLRIRVLRPLAQSVRVRFEDGTVIDLHHEAQGVWSGLRPDTDRTMDYRVLTTWGDGVEHEQDDPYRFAPTLGDIDLFLINEGRHEELWNVLGAHVQEYDGPMGTVHGTSFSVWAPRAKAVRLIGNFNSWNGSSHPMRLIGHSGVWELFVPGVGAGEIYKFEIKGADDVWRTKVDPLARRTEVPPATASIVDDSRYDWSDQAWQEHKRTTDPHRGKMSIYEVHLGSWRQGLTYTELAEHLVNYVSDLGFTHVEFLPVMEHPYAPSWGYQVTGYYAPTARFGTPDEFRYLVDRLHQAGIGVLLDWVPGHFPRDDWALAKFDGLPLYEHPDPRRGDQPDWGTHIFDFGRLEVRNFLVANALYWLEEFHIDGLRVDAVASMLYLDYSRRDGEWLPNVYGGRENLEAIGLLQEANATAYKRVPGIVTVAEESTSWPGVTRDTASGGLGFGYKWNMGWMNDTLRYLHAEPINRQYHHNLMTFAMMYSYSENFILPISHDEVVHGKGSLVNKIPGHQYDQLATLRTYLAYMWSHPGKQLLFMGCEFAQSAEWNDGKSLDWWLLDQPAHYRIHNLVKELNRIYHAHPALWALDHDPAGFEWLDANDNHGNTFRFMRFAEADRTGDVVVSVLNFAGADHHDLRVGVPRAGDWTILLDTAGFDEFGSPSGAGATVTAEDIPWNGQPHSVRLHVKQLSAMFLVPADAATSD